MSFKLNPFTGRFDQDGDSVNFSIASVVDDIEVPSNQQMILIGKCSVGQKLSIRGRLVLKSKIDQSIKSDILAREQARVNTGNQEMIDRIKNHGSIKVFGKLRVGRVELDSAPPYFLSHLEQFRINQHKQCLIFGGLKNQGNLKIKGKLKIK